MVSDCPNSSQLTSKQLVGMLLIAIVKASSKDLFTQVQTASVGAGIMGLMVERRFFSRMSAVMTRHTGKQGCHRFTVDIHAGAVRGYRYASSRSVDVRERPFGGL